MPLHHRWSVAFWKGWVIKEALASSAWCGSSCLFTQVRELNSGELLIHFPLLIFKREGLCFMIFPWFSVTTQHKASPQRVVFIFSFFVTDITLLEYCKAIDKMSKKGLEQATEYFLIVWRENECSSPSFWPYCNQVNSIFSYYPICKQAKGRKHGK